MKPPPPIQKEILGVFKSQNLMMMQKALDNTSRCLSVHATIIATPDLIKLNLYLCFCMEHQRQLGHGPTSVWAGPENFC